MKKCCENWLRWKNSTLNQTKNNVGSTRGSFSNTQREPCTFIRSKYSGAYASSVMRRGVKRKSRSTKAALGTMWRVHSSANRALFSTASRIALNTHSLPAATGLRVADKSISHHLTDTSISTRLTVTCMFSSGDKHFNSSDGFMLFVSAGMYKHFN